MTATYEQKKQSVLQLIRTTISFSHQIQQTEYVNLLEGITRRLDEGKFIVVVCGEFRRGKSSLLNAFLNEMQDFFPVDISVTTNLVTTITYGPREKITAIIGEPGSEQEITNITRAEIRRYVTEKDNPRNVREARLMNIETPNAQLKQGLTLVDTPGIGALYAQHTDITYEFIPNADAILFVSDTVKPLSEIDLKFIKERILPYTRDIIFVLTKKDQVKDYTIILEDNRKKLAATLECSEDQITIVPVSSLAKNDYLKSHESEDLLESNFPQLESTLWQFIGAQRGRIVLAKALDELSRVVGNLRRPVQVAYDTCKEQDQKKRDKIGADIKETRSYLQRLLDERAEWQIQLRYGMESVQREIQYQFNQGFTNIRRTVDGYVLDDQIMDNPALVLDPLQADINNLLYGLDRAINQAASELQARIKSITGLSLNPFELDALLQHAKELSISGIPPVPQQDSALDDAMHVARNTTFLTFTFNAIGNFLGLGDLGGIVMGLAAGASWLLNSKEKKKKIRERGRQHLKKYLHEMLEDTQNELKNELFNTIRNLEQTMRSDLLEEIKREKQNRDKSLKSFEEAQRLMNTSQSAMQIKSLKGQLQQLDQIQHDVETLAKAITSHDDDPAAMRNDSASAPEPSSSEYKGNKQMNDEATVANE